MKISINKQKISSILESVMSGSSAPIASMNASTPQLVDIYPNSKKYKPANKDGILENAGILGMSQKMNQPKINQPSVQDHSTQTTLQRASTNKPAPGSDLPDQKPFQQNNNISNFTKSAGHRINNKMF